jgi:membrane-associated phospholipid phosphatase
MPSFHTILGVLFAYALRHVRYIFSFSVALNLVMIASTPTQGGHYLADLLGGLAVAAATIAIVRISTNLLSGREAQSHARLKQIEGIG